MAQAEELVPLKHLFSSLLLELVAEGRLVWDTGALLHRQPLLRAWKRKIPLRRVSVGDEDLFNVRSFCGGDRGQRGGGTWPSAAGHSSDVKI